MLAIKMLMDADAVEGKSVLNVSGTDVDMVASMNELVRLGVVVHGGTSDGGVTTWVLFQKSASSLEIITRVFGPQFALLAKTESTTPSDMSILGLVGALERAGWDHRVWDDSEGTKPPPVDVARGRPKHFYGKPDASTLIFSKFYLQALLAIDRITCSGEIEHYETDAYYKWLISNGVTKKRKRANSAVLMDDASALAALMADAPKRVRRGGRRGIGLGGAGRGAIAGRIHKKNARTTQWGPCLITITEKKGGTTSVQATCHRKHAHPPMRGRESTICRQTFNVTRAHSEADCIRLLKLWLGHAEDYTTRLKHQRKRFALDELVDDEVLEAMKPALGYDTSSEPEAAPVPVVDAALARRPRMRIRAKAPHG